MLAHLVMDATPDWPLPDHEAVHRSYFRGRDKKNGLKVSRTLEAGLSLVLAERFRAVGDAERAQKLVSFAVDNYPGHLGLRTLEETFNLQKQINWREVLLPSPAAPETENA
jgi:hypothetical protein